jgi:transcriptional regulator with XRE-family HTH domain
VRARERPSQRPKGKSRTEEAPLKDFGQRVRRLREKRGLTQDELATAIGVTIGIVSRYERNVHLPTADKVVALARVLHVTADCLLRGDRKGEEPVPFQNVRLFERFRSLDRLPKNEQEAVMRIMDAVIERHEYHEVSERRRATS